MNKTNYGPRVKLKSLVAAITLMVTPGMFVPTADAKLPGYYQQKPVTGKVTDDKGEGIGNVSVSVQGTNRGALTNPDGTFSVNASQGETLLFSIVGYKRISQVVGTDANVAVTLIADASALADVVVVGYGTQKKVTVTGAVAQVKGSELQKAPVFNLSNALVGRLPGITAVQSSGEPGYDGSSIRIRGTNAFGNNAPLVVIDGVPERAGGLERLNPADIETVSVLKDASAAIYGQRAANGVILITTKRGKTGKPTLTYDFNQGWAQPTRIPKMMNVNQYGEVRNEIAVFEGVTNPAEWPAAMTALNSSGTYTTTTGTAKTITSPTGFFPEDIAKYKDGTDIWGHPNTDWFGDVIKQWSPQQRHNLQVSGGNENVRYLASLGYLDQDGIYKNSATGYKQYDLRINLDAKINKYVSVQLGVTGREEFRFFPTESAGSIFRMLMRGKPNEPAIWPNGLPGRDIENGQNPVVITTNQTGYDKDKRDYIQTNGKLEILIPGVEGLKVTGMAALDKLMFTGKRWATPWYLYSWDKVTYEADGVTPQLTKELRSTFTDPRLNQATRNTLNTTLTGMVNYDKKFGDHAIGIMAGVQRETVNEQAFGAYRRYFISTAVDQLFAGGAEEKDNGGSEFNRARLSYFGRAGYNFQEKYIAEFVWRYDGSYTFPKDNRFGFFPGIMAGWRISEENFFKDNVRFIDNLKLRGSWGQVGAEPYINGQLAEFQYLGTYGFSSYIIDGSVTPGLYETLLPNPNFTWEVQTSVNLGLEASTLNNRLSVELDYFKNKRDKALFRQLGSIPGSAIDPNLLPPVNYAKLENQGWEFKINYADQTSGLRYNVGVNGGYAKNKIIKWDEITENVPEYQWAVGKPFGSNGASYLVYQYDGIFATQKDIDDNTISYSDVGGANLRPGDMKFKDVNGDGKINNDDRVRMDKTRDPTFTYGFNINLDYHNFDLAILFQGATGGLLWVQTESGDIGNYLEEAYFNRWTIDNPSTVFPRIASRDNTYYTGGSGGNNSYKLRNTNYLRLKNFELGYTVPSKLTKRVGISTLRPYVNGINLFCWDKLKSFDPESTNGAGSYYPQTRIINIGARVTF